MPRVSVISAFALLVLSLLSSSSPGQQTASGQPTASRQQTDSDLSHRIQPQSQIAGAQPNKPSQKATIIFKDGRLSLDARNLPLSLLVDDLSGKTQVPVLLDSDVVDLPISISFQGLALDEGLRRIFKNYDTFYMYGSAENEPASLKAVWVYPKGKASGLEPVPPEKWASTKELRGSLNSKDPQVRARAVRALVERGGSKALPTVTRALADTDPDVRASALYGATDAGLQVPEDSLRNLVTNDESAEVRFLALQSMADSEDVRSVAEAALNDPSEPIRVQAREILSRLSGASTQPADMSPPNNRRGPQ